MPFTVDQFFDVFETYNMAIWPAQIVAYFLGVTAVILGIRDTKMRGRILTAILALSWVWIGVFYHYIHFSQINQAAYVFGTLFVVQGILFFIFGSICSRLRFRFVSSPIPIVGALFLLYALVLYPLIGNLSGHAYPRCPVFGVAPCPSTIFTFGIMLWASRPISLYLVIIPLLWSLVGVMAAFNLNVPQDYGLGVAGILGTVLLIVRNRKLKKEANQIPE